MGRVVVRDDRTISGADPATVWALVADPARLGDWSRLHLVGYMGRELPSVGSVFFAKRRARGADTDAVRFEFVEWVAGSRYRCAMAPGRFGEDREVEVRVHSVLEEDGAHTVVEVFHRAEVPQWAFAAYRMVAERSVRRALDGLERSCSSR